MNIRSIKENNFTTNFIPLENKGVAINIYTKGQHLDTFSQPEPDAVLDFTDQQYFQARKVHGIDQKSDSGTLRNSQVFFKYRS